MDDKITKCPECGNEGLGMLHFNGQALSSGKIKMELIDGPERTADGTEWQDWK